MATEFSPLSDNNYRSSSDSPLPNNVNNGASQSPLIVNDTAGKLGYIFEAYG